MEKPRYEITPGKLFENGKCIGNIEGWDSTPELLAHAKELNPPIGSVVRLTGTLFAHRCEYGFDFYHNLGL